LTDFISASAVRPDSVPGTFGEAVRAWARIAAQSFGGPAGQIAVIHRVVVEEKRWLDEPRFLHALSYCMLLPGPEAQQLVTYTGWLLYGVRGGLTAGLLFILPGFLAILGLSIAYTAWRDVTLVSGLFLGLKPAVVAIVVGALWRLWPRAMTLPWHVPVALGAFLGLFVLGLPFPLIILAAGLFGALVGPAPPGLSESAPAPRIGRLFRTVLVWGIIWFLPLPLLGLLRGAPIFRSEALFFGKVAVVTFGGAYAVLSYVAQQAVEVHHWIGAGEMLDGLGLAETTPGPLIMVLQFVGFLGAFRAPGPLNPYLAGVIASLVTVWFTFAPCFLFVFAVAPYVEWIRGRPRVQGALSGIMAAVFGVVLNLAVWFTLHVNFGTVARRRLGPFEPWVPAISTVQWTSVGLTLVAVVAALRFRLPTWAILLGGALLGVLLRAG